MSNNKQPHGFCETPHEKCTMNYCDENGCMNRKRNLVEEPIEVKNDKQDHIGDANKKVSSVVDWLYKVMLKPLSQWPDDIWEQANVMHKQEIIGAYAQGSNDRLKNIINNDYYNETYKSE